MRMRVATNRAGILLAIMRPGQLKTKPEQGGRRLSRTHNSSKETAYGSTRVKKTHKELVVFRREFLSSVSSFWLEYNDMMHFWFLKVP